MFQNKNSFSFSNVNDTYLLAAIYGINLWSSTWIKNVVFIEKLVSPLHKYSLLFHIESILGKSKLKVE